MISLTQIARNNPANMYKGQDFCSRRCGHWAMGSQMFQTWSSQALAWWPNLPVVPQSLFFTVFHNLQCCGVLYGVVAGMFVGSDSARFYPRKILIEAPRSCFPKKNVGSVVEKGGQTLVRRGDPRDGGVQLLKRSTTVHPLHCTINWSRVSFPQ